MSTSVHIHNVQESPVDKDYTYSTYTNMSTSVHIQYTMYRRVRWTRTIRTVHTQTCPHLYRYTTYWCWQRCSRWIISKSHDMTFSNADLTFGGGFWWFIRGALLEITDIKKNMKKSRTGPEQWIFARPYMYRVWCRNATK